jgi:hypothetical protein
MVKGEQFLDDLLVNALEPDVTIEFILCQSESEVEALWHASVANPDAAGPPWLIHPAIVTRHKIASGAGGDFIVSFSPYSAMRDESADVVIKSAATRAQTEGAGVVLTSYKTDNAPAFAVDLAKLRLGVIQAELTACGIDEDMIRREEMAGGDDQADQIGVRVLPA